MANEYVLVIKNDAKEGVASNAGGAGGIQRSDGSGNSAGGESSGGATAEKALKTVFGYTTIKSFANQAVGFQVSTVQLRTGSTEAQQRANFFYNMGQSVLSIGESVIGGLVMTGGNPIGAVLGIAVGIAHKTIDLFQRIERIEMERRLELASAGITAQRATVSGSRYQNATMGG